MLAALLMAIPFASADLMQPSMWNIMLPFKSASPDININMSSDNSTIYTLSQALTSPCSNAADCAYYVNQDCTGALHFYAPYNGTLYSSSYSRSEMFQETTVGTSRSRASWLASDTNTMIGTWSVDKNVPTVPIEVFTTSANSATGKINVKANTSGGNATVYMQMGSASSTKYVLDATYTYSTPMTLNITVSGNIVYATYYNYASGVSGSANASIGTGAIYCGFRTGAFNSVALPSDKTNGARVTIYDLQLYGPGTTTISP